MVNHFQSVKYIFSTDLKRFKTPIYPQLEDFQPCYFTFYFLQKEIILVFQDPKA